MYSIDNFVLTSCPRQTHFVLQRGIESIEIIINFFFIICIHFVLYNAENDGPWPEYYIDDDGEVQRERVIFSDDEQISLCLQLSAE